MTYYSSNFSTQLLCTQWCRPPNPAEGGSNPARTPHLQSKHLFFGKVCKKKQWELKMATQSLSKNGNSTTIFQELDLQESKASLECGWQNAVSSDFVLSQLTVKRFEATKMLLKKETPSVSPSAFMFCVDPCVDRVAVLPAIWWKHRSGGNRHLKSEAWTYRNWAEANVPWDDLLEFWWKMARSLLGCKYSKKALTLAHLFVWFSLLGPILRIRYMHRSTGTGHCRVHLVISAFRTKQPTCRSTFQTSAAKILHCAVDW